MMCDPEARGRFHQFLKDTGDWVIVGHRNPDGDCLGVMAALYEIGVQDKRNIRLFSADPVPSIYRFLPGMTHVQHADTVDCAGAALIYLECPTPDRCGIRFENEGCTVNLDHHPDNTRHGDIVLLDSQASSIGEMMTGYLSDMTPGRITQTIASALYAAIHTDTGGFSYGNTSEAALRSAATLVSAGADVAGVCASVYQQHPVNRLQLLGRYLGRLETRAAGRIGVGCLLMDDLAEFNCTLEDTDGFSNYPRSLSGVSAGIFVLQTAPDAYKVSLRSKDEMVVNRTAREFGGGGHAKAAGFSRSGSLTDIVNETVASILKNNE